MAEKEKVYKCLNPVGIQSPVNSHPLAPRDENPDDKTIHSGDCAEPDITVPPEKRHKGDYPD